MNLRKILLLASRILLGVVFIFAAVGKIANPGGFAEDIDNYRMLPYILVVIMAVVLPWTEAVCGVLIISGKWLKGSSFLLILLNIMFIIAVSSAVIRGLDIECGCFSLASSVPRVGLVRLLEDFFLLALSIFVFREAAKSRNPSLKI